MENLNLEAGALIILSAPPASGKSTFLKNNDIPKDMVLSSDQIREDFFGTSHGMDEEGAFNIPSHNAEAEVFSILKKILDKRLKEKQTTFLDATSVKDSVRKDYVKMAEKHGVKSVILIFDVDKETCIKQDKLRINRVGEKVINKFFEDFQKESRFEHYLINSNTKLNLKPNQLPQDNIDIIGDTHGFYKETVNFIINTLGYELKDGIFVHPEGRKLLFEGDFVDRGQESIEMLRMVYRNCKYGGHHAIVGNHENKLINFYSDLKEGKVRVSSRSSAETAMEFARLEKEEQEKLHQFLVNLPHYYIRDKFAFTHAGLSFFDPLKTPRSFCIYGDSRRGNYVNHDFHYEELFQKDFNNYYLIRGHNELTDESQTTVITLDNNIGFNNGTLNAIKLDDAIKAKNQDPNFDLKPLIFRKKVDFDYKQHLENKFQLQTDLNNLVKQKLATKNTDETGFMSLYKYSKSVFFNQSWSKDKNLLKCRGLVLDLAGNIIVNPFDKIFNYGEPNHLKEETATNVSNDKKVVMVDKLNGYLGLITLNPFKKNQLLINTQGTFEKFKSSGDNELKDSLYASYIRELVGKEKLYGGLLKYLNQNNVTLMFEVIHPEDKGNHIVQYGEDMEGLHLIGVRKNEFNSPVFTEEQADKVANEIGCRRASYKTVTLGEAKKIIDTATNEGAMIRDAEDENQEFICKFKTPHYLIVKFLSRMGKTNFNKMYDNPKEFKKHINVEEEFYPLIDFLTENIEREDFYKLNEDDRKSLVRKAIDNMRKDVQEQKNDLLRMAKGLDKPNSKNKLKR